MSRPQSSLMDYANFGTNVYQSRQTAKLAKAAEAQNALIEQMQMQQQLEMMKKELIITARKVLIEAGDLVENLNLAFEKYPAHTAISIEMVDDMLEPLTSDLFEEIADIERHRTVEKSIAKLKRKVDNLSSEEIEIREKMIHIMTHGDQLTLDIETAKINEENQVKLSELKPQWEESQDEWIKLEHESLVRVKSTKKVGLLYFLSSIFLLPVTFGISSIVLQLPEDDVMVAVVTILLALSAWPLINVYKLYNYPMHPLKHLKDEIWLLEYGLLDLDQTNERFASNYEGDCTSDKMVELQKYWNEYIDYYTPDEDEDFSEYEPQKVRKSQTLFSATKKAVSSGTEKVKDVWEKSGPKSPPRNSPPEDMNGQVDNDGYEWLEYPVHSEKWWYREPSNSNWERWEE